MSAVDCVTAYFDETRVDGEHPFPVVAGFCNTCDVWEAFENKWREAAADVLDNDVKKYFRYRPSGHCTPEEEKRYRDALTLARVMRDFTLWPIHASIEREFFQPTFNAVVKSDNPLISSAYSVCSYLCCELLDELASQALRPDLTPVKVVFDSGNADERWLDKGYSTYYAHKPGTKLKRKISFESDEDLIPLRAADAYAWLLGRKYNENEELEQLRIIHDPRIQFRRKELVITAERARQVIAMIDSENGDAEKRKTS